MKFSKEFNRWWESELKKYEISRDNVFADKVLEWDMRSDIYFISIGTLYAAFKAHDEELKRLRKFEKTFRKIQAKLVKYDELRWSNMRYEILYENVIEELEYL